VCHVTDYPVCPKCNGDPDAKTPKLKSPIDKTIKGFREALSGWTGSAHYKGGDIEWIDMAYSKGTLTHDAAFAIGKYAVRICWGDRTPEEIKKDCLKLAHFAGFIFDNINEG
jgi:hypothetical protein